MKQLWSDERIERWIDDYRVKKPGAMGYLHSPTWADVDESMRMVRDHYETKEQQPMDDEGDKVIPQKAGLYWGKSNQYNYDYDLIVDVSGEAPFLRMNVWRISTSVVDVDVSPSRVQVWGPRIPEPPRPVMAKR